MSKVQYMALLIALLQFSCGSTAQAPKSDIEERFNQDKDLLLANFDCKTDVDDLHSVAAFATLMAHPDYSEIQYHAVAGTYGTQSGLYVPPNELFQLAFGNNWTDAHANRPIALLKVKDRVSKILDSGGNIWIADAGQSDFSALLIKSIEQERPDIQTKARFHVVQHSKWNENATSKEHLEYVKKNSSYHKIPDGNAVDNGSPGFRTYNYPYWRTEVKDKKIRKLWELAVSLGDQYNGKEGRYNNKAIASGGLDFSDLSETCFILGLEHIKDTAEFFESYGQ